MNEIFTADSHDMDLRFKAYYTTSIYFRRNDKFDEMIELFRKYSSIFTDYPPNFVIKSFEKRYLALQLNNSKQMGEAVHFSKQLKDIFPDHKAILHHYAEMVSTAIENDLYDNDDKAQMISDAINCMLKCIGIWERNSQTHAKVYATLGRLYLLQEEYENAVQFINKAINYEDGQTPESFRKVIKYYAYLYDIKSQKSIKELQNKEQLAITELQNLEKNLSKKSTSATKDMENNFDRLSIKLEEAKTKHLEILAFFSSVLALLISGTNLLANMSVFYEAAGLFVILLGVLLIAFCSLSFLLEINRLKRYMILIHVFVIVIAVLLLVTGYILGTGYFSYM